MLLMNDPEDLALNFGGFAKNHLKKRRVLRRIICHSALENSRTGDLRSDRIPDILGNFALP